MDTVTILRQLWRFRLLVLVVGLLGVAAGFAVSFKLSYPLESRKYEVGVATARILVDTPESHVVGVAPEGSDSLGARATLLSNLMVDGEIKAAIAKRAGLDVDRLYGMSQTASAPISTEAPDRDSHVLTAQVLTAPDGGSLPIIEVIAQAPDAAGAKRLADAAVAGLTEFLDSKAAADAVPDAERLRIGGLGVAQAQQVTRGPRLLMSALAALFVFVLGCATILGIAELVRALRAVDGTQVVDAPVVPPAAATPDAWEASESDVPWSVEVPEPVVVPPPQRDADAAADAPISTDVELAAPEATSPSQRGPAWWGGGPGAE